MFRFTAMIALCFFALVACSGETAPSSNSPPVEFPSDGGSYGSVTASKGTVQFNEVITATATFKKIDGSPAAGVTVNFVTTLGAFNPANGVTMTDSSGTATIQLNAGTTAGQGTITATANVDGKNTTKSGYFTVTLPPLKLSEITLGLSTLSYGGSTSVSVKVTDTNGAVLPGQEVDVTFTSTQSASGKASIASPVRTVNGIATTTYQANSATGADTITASITGDSKTATVTINPLAAASISFVSAEPATIGLKGMGGAGIKETSKVTFKVLDTSGEPKANQQVDFLLNTYSGGLQLDELPSGSGSSGSTASDGTVSTIVQSGIISTPVRVTASIRGTNPLIATQSDQLVVSTGVPAQDGFSISIGTLNPECWNVDGVQDIVTARLSDHFHNPVPDGTAVYFTTSGGSIQPSCITAGGTCSVTWTSQNPRPANGRAVILAYAIGEEAFIDSNGNGAADPGEFTDTTGAFRDDNENGTLEPGETFIPFNQTGQFDLADGKYNGVLQGTAYTGAPKSKHIFSNNPLVMASSGALISNSCGDAVNIPLGSIRTCSILVSDIHSNVMPAGTTVEFAIATQAPGSTVSGASTKETSLAMTAYTFTFPNSSAATGVNIPVSINDPSLTTSARGTVTVTVTTPGKIVTRAIYPVN